MRSILVIKCFQTILSISTLQNKHSLLFGCVTHLGIVIGKMLGMERLFYIKEKQGMHTSQIGLLERSPLQWGERLVQHSGILKVRVVLYSWESTQQLRQALHWVPCGGFRVKCRFAQEASGWTPFLLCPATLWCISHHPWPQLPIQLAGAGPDSVGNLGGHPNFISGAMLKYLNKNNVGEKSVILAHDFVL